jgi:acetyltransferase-like isoleucine patch superfamily enzyme
MGSKIDSMLEEISQILDSGPDATGTKCIIEKLGGGVMPLPLIEEAVLYCELLPKIEEFPYTPEMRNLHFIWDSFDKLPTAAIANFAIPLRRLIAQRLFKKCGKNFICEEGLRFNYANNIEIGDDVFFNRGCFIDSKGGVRIGDGVGFTEGVFIYTHNHSEADHMIRTYKPVVFEDYSMIYSFAIILPGVTVGREAIVSARAVVHDDVESGIVVSGAPAKVVRPIHNDGHHKKELNHIWLNRGAFQKSNI